MALPLLASFGTGLAMALALGSLARVLLGMKLNLFLVNHDSAVQDQTMIPVTTEGKKTSFIRTLLNGLWREDVDITLTDYSSASFRYRVGYHLWWRFYLVMAEGGDGSAIDGRPVLPGKRYLLRTGARLKVGDRVFYVLVTPTQMKSDLHKELFES